MAQLLTPDTFEFFARYLLAGYIVIIVRSRFVLADRLKPTELVIEAVILSLVSQLLFQIAVWALLWILPQTVLDILPDRSAFFIEVLLLPSLLGMVLGLNVARGWNNAVLRRLSMPLSNPVHRAHDFAFFNRDPGFVILTYSDGTQVAGYFGLNSMAASDGARSDIFLERLYVIGEDDQWRGTSPARSGLLSLANVRSIEFLETEEKTDAEE